MNELYALTASTKDAVEYLIDQRPPRPDDDITGPARKQICWVRVLSGPKPNGWFVGKVSTPTAPDTFTDHAAEIEVLGIGGEPLERRRYLCIRQGETDGIPRFRAVSEQWRPVKVTGGSDGAGYTVKPVKWQSGMVWEEDPPGVEEVTAYRFYSSLVEAPTIEAGQITLGRPIPHASGDPKPWEIIAPGSMKLAAEPESYSAGEPVWEEGKLYAGFCFVDDVETTFECSGGGVVVRTVITKKFAEFKETKARDLEFKVEVKDCGDLDGGE